MHKTRFFTLAAVFAGSMMMQSTNAQGLITSFEPFYEQDFENAESRDLLEQTGNWAGVEGYWEPGTFEDDPVYEGKGRFADGIGNPGKAVEVSADFSVPSALPIENAPYGRQSLRQNPATQSGIVRDLTDPETQVRLSFDLYTSQTSPVEVNVWFRPPSRGSINWGAGIGDVTNDSPNTWQSHFTDFYAFGLTPEDRMTRVLLYEGFAMDAMDWRFDTDDWGHESDNIMRLDNVRMSIIPETSEYIFASGMCLIGFVAFRRIRIAKIAKSS